MQIYMTLASLEAPADFLPSYNCIIIKHRKLLLIVHVIVFINEFDL